MDISATCALRMEGITKQFPGVLANDHIDFEVKCGEVLGLLGENGAGKTTLMNILYGLHKPDSGTIYIQEKKLAITSPAVAVHAGIGMVHQHFMLVEPLTALENVILGMPQRRPPLLDLDQAKRRFEQLAVEYDLQLEPSTLVWQLPVSDQQWLEILKQLFRNANLLVLDEPTAVLAPAQIRQLFRVIRRLVEEGRSVIFISHKLNEVLDVTDRITVLRDGRVQGTVITGETNRAELARMMVGRPISMGRRARPKIENKNKVLRVENLSCNNDRHLPALRDLTLDVYAGEIVGIAGVDGNGQRELADCISGLRVPTSGNIYINDKPIHDVVRDTSLLGFVPEDRHKTGLITTMTVEENLVLKSYNSAPYARNGLLQWKAIRSNANELIEKYNIKTPSASITVKNLSGGNQQRVVVARELSSNPALLMTSQPTRGLDLGAVDGVHEILLQERNQGAAVMFISTELQEVMSISDRILVFFKGELMGEVDGESASVNQIGEMMLGHRIEKVQEPEVNNGLSS